MTESQLNVRIPEYIYKKNRKFLDRYKELSDWFDRHSELGISPDKRLFEDSLEIYCKNQYNNRRLIESTNFTSIDHLNLSSSYPVICSAKRAIDSNSLHRRYSPGPLGNTQASDDLEQSLSEFTQYSDITLFPSGWAARYATIKRLVKESDYVLIDVLCHESLHQIVNAVTSNVKLFAHLSCISIENRLRKIRERDANSTILVVTESLFSMDSEVPDLSKTQIICTEYEATLLIDCAQDFGSIGAEGNGFLEVLDMVTKIDVLVGCFSNTFAAEGGFVATNNHDLKLAIRATSAPWLFSSTISPVSAKVVSKCLSIIRSHEGNNKRRQLLENSYLLRTLLVRNGFDVLGQSSGIVPVVLGDAAYAHRLTSEAIKEGAIVDLIEHPTISENSCRWCLRVMADHTPEQIRNFLSRIVAARDRAQ